MEWFQDGPNGFFAVAGVRGFEVSQQGDRFVVRCGRVGGLPIRIATEASLEAAKAAAEAFEQKFPAQ